MNNNLKILFEEKNLSDVPNVKLVEYMDILTNEFENLKSQIISMTLELDSIENLYNKILKEYQKRT